MSGFALVFLAAALSSCGTAIDVPIAPEAWANPNLLVDRARLNEIRRAAASGHPVLAPAYADLIRTADIMMAASPEPIHGPLEVPGFFTRERETQRRITRRLRNDARTAHALALACALSENRQYGEKAREFLYAWVDNLTIPKHGGRWWHWPTPWRRGDTPIVISYSFPAFIFAFDLLRGEDILSDDEVARFQQWLGPYVDYLGHQEFYKNNHHNWQVVFLLSAAHVLQDEALFKRAAEYYRRGIRGQIRGDGALPRELWRRQRSGTYTLMALEGMVQAVHIAEKHGIMLRDLQSRGGGTLEKAIDFYCDYLDDPESWARHTNARTLNTPAGTSDWGYIFELPYRWWHNPRYLGYMQKRPYGFEVERCYTLDFATLLFAE